MLEPGRRRADRIAVVRNPKSGTAPDADALARAFRDAGVVAQIHDSPSTALPQWLDCLARNSDVLVAAGGDGTVSAVATAVAKSGKSLGVLPTGTLNHFAKDLGIPVELGDAAAVIAHGRERAVDVGIVNEQLFLNNVSLGNYPCMVHERDRLEHDGRSRPIAAGIAVARTWWRLGKLTSFLTIDGTELVRRSPFIVVGNGRYTLEGLSLGTREEISDGQLSLYVAPGTGRLGVLALPFRALAGTLERHEQFEEFIAGRITAVFSHRQVEAGIDGEVQQLRSPLEFSIRRGGLRVLVPAQDKP